MPYVYCSINTIKIKLTARNKLFAIFIDDIRSIQCNLLNKYLVRCVCNFIFNFLYIILYVHVRPIILLMYLIMLIE